MEDIVRRLEKLEKTISTMESCTGGAVANAITNVEGASNILKFSAVTYSNEFKIKMGVEKELIDKYSVYSMEVAKNMAKNISEFTSSNYGIGITGKLSIPDPMNEDGIDNQVFISIYDRDDNKYFNDDIFVTGVNRKESKEQIVNKIIDMLKIAIN